MGILRILNNLVLAGARNLSHLLSSTTQLSWKKKLKKGVGGGDCYLFWICLGPAMLGFYLDFQLADHLHLDTGLGGAPVIQLMLCG